jgi:hypothetical protein
VLLRSAHSSSTRRRAVGAPWHGRRNLFLTQEILGGQVVVLNNLNHHVEQGNREKPKAKAPAWHAKCRWEKSTDRVVERTRPNPKMRRGLSGLPIYWKVDEHTRTRGIIVIQATGA